MRSVGGSYTTRILAGTIIALIAVVVVLNVMYLDLRSQYLEYVTTTERRHNREVEAVTNRMNQAAALATDELKQRVRNLEMQVQLQQVAAGDDMITSLEQQLHECRSSLLQQLRKIQSPLPSTPLLGSKWSERTAVVVICYNRPDYLTRTLRSVLGVFPGPGWHTELYISQDGNVRSVTRVIEDTIKQNGNIPIHHIQHEQDPRLETGYHKLASHFKFALDHLFNDKAFDRVIIIEDDMEIAVDFFDYFFEVGPLLVLDPTVWCISAWNDHGQVENVNDPAVLLRSDFFPGLGWMLHKNLWQEISSKWPSAYWDDWLREPQQRKGRVCIRPEINRSYTFGQQGTSASQYFKDYLAPIKLNDVKVDWAAVQPVPSLLPSTYDPLFIKKVKGATLLKTVNEFRRHTTGSYYVIYRDFDEYERVASELRLIPDVKAGVPRAAYMGVVQIRNSQATLYIVPESF